MLVSSDPADEIFTTEYFGPILGVHVYDDADWTRHARAGSSRRRAVRADRSGVRHRPGRDRSRPPQALRFAAGNFYVNDKPTGAVVGQQPFGGARASGTNDKAGSMLNLHALGVAAHDQGDVRPADRVRYPHQG